MGQSALDACEHVVQFYETDEFLVHEVGKFIGAGLGAGETGIVFATPAHRAALEEMLSADGLDIERLRRSGRYIALDAAQALSACLVDGVPDPDRFAAVVGEVVIGAIEDGRPVRVFGELVALLTDEGNHAAAIRLEAFWNELQRAHDFTLLCGYRMDAFGGASFAGHLNEVCAAHSRVIPTESYSALADSDERLRAITALQQRSAALEAEVAQRKATEALLAGQNQVLAMIAVGTPLTEVLAALIQMIEEQADDGLRCSVLVRDPQEEQFTLGVAPNLPVDYIEALAHASISPPYLGPCGRAADLGEDVITQDVAVDERWAAAWRELAISHDLRFCHSSPIIASDGSVLGAFAMYYQNPGDPKPVNSRLLAMATHLAAIAIEQQQVEMDWRRSEELTRRVLDSSADSIKLLDLDGNVLYMSPGSLRLLEIDDLAAHLHHSWLELWNAPDRDRARDALAAARTGQVVTFEGYRPTAKGTPKWWDVLICPIHDLDEQPSQLLAISRDITERKRVETLRTMETRVLEMVARREPLPQVLIELVRIIEELGDGLIASVLLLDDDGRHLRHGAALDLPDTYIQAIDGVEIGPRVGSCGTAAYRGEQVIVENIAIDPRWVDYRDLALAHGLRACWSTPIRSANGQVLGTFALYYHAPRKPSRGDLDLINQVAWVAGLAIDRVQAEDTLQASEERFRAFVTASSDVVYRMSPDWSVMREMQGGNFLANTGEPLDDWLDIYIHPDDQDQVLAAIDEAVRTKSVFEMEYRMWRADGTIGWTFSRAVPILDEDGALVEWFGAASDITARKLTEHALVEARFAAEQAARSREDFLSIASHELRNPVTTLSGTAQLMRRAWERGRLTEERLGTYIGSLERAGNHLAALTNDLLDVSHLQRGELPFRPEPVDVARLLRDIVRRDEWHGRSVILEGAEESLDVVIDVDRIRQVVVNLLSNAVKYSPSGDEVRLRLLRDDTGLLIEVQDFGIGLPPEAVESIFTPFQRAPNASRSGIPGLGLGLFIARRIAEQHGGRLWASSHGEGCGTVMSLWLPNHPRRSVERERPVSEAADA